MTEASHRTAVVPLSITCPTWCDEYPEFHLNELSSLGARCIHPMPRAVFEDEVGFKPWGAKQRFQDDVDVWLSMITDIEGRETEPATIFINGHDYTLTQALALADEIRRQIELYRSTGGVA